MTQHYNRRDFLKGAGLWPSARPPWRLPLSAEAVEEKLRRDWYHQRSREYAPKPGTTKLTLIVVGSGGAGLATSVAARQNNASVILIKFLPKKRRAAILVSPAIS